MTTTEPAYEPPAVHHREPVTGNLGGKDTIFSDPVR